MHKLLLLFGLIAVISACASTENSSSETRSSNKQVQPSKTNNAVFEWFSYQGNDPAFNQSVSKEEYQNPVLAGFYPDPSVVRVKDDYYLVTSTFGFYPGIPVFHSRDLVNWQQIGNVIDRPDMLDFKQLGLSWGVFAATISYHDGIYYVANTCVFCGGNYIVTATDPAGAWSDPIWLPEVGGIDPSLFFDDDGRVYLVHNDTSEESRDYFGHNYLLLQELDINSFNTIGDPVVLLDKGVGPENNPVWLEGPHLYKVDGMYYLTAAQGGTREGHEQVILRAKNAAGPYEIYSQNPILTQKDLSKERENPVTSTGHADLVQDQTGQWWAVFLGVRPYLDSFHNTGRETFLLPVTWSDGWPLILPPSVAVPYSAPKPSLSNSLKIEKQQTGNFAYREEFDQPLGHDWLFARIPKTQWWQVADGNLTITPRAERIGDQRQPSVVLKRQQHQNVVVETAMRFQPQSMSDEAGLIAMQNDAFYYAFGLGQDADGEPVLRLRQRSSKEQQRRGNSIASQRLKLEASSVIKLRISINGEKGRFEYAIDQGEYQTLHDNADTTILSTITAGGFVGAMLGMYAEGEAL